MRATTLLFVALISQSVFAKTVENSITDSRRLELAGQVLSQGNIAYTDLALAKDNVEDKIGKLLIKAYSLVTDEVENQDVTPVTFVDSQGLRNRCLLFISKNPIDKTATITSCEFVQKNNIHSTVAF
ncbi:MAG: hypothetical protein ACXVCY_07930 [Pseudobdellovibrionaceae bacterium]